MNARPHPVFGYRSIRLFPSLPRGVGRVVPPGENLAFSLAEVLVSVLLVGGLLVVALNTVGDATIARQKTSDRGRGQLLAQDLLAEILLQAYEDPVEVPTFGREPTESSVSRASYDDVDDYDGWDASPPQQKDGTAMADLVGWRRTAAVTYVTPDDLRALVGGDQGIKRIAVTVTHHDVEVALLTAIRTTAAAEFEPER